MPRGRTDIHSASFRELEVFTYLIRGLDPLTRRQQVRLVRWLIERLQLAELESEAASLDLQSPALEDIERALEDDDFEDET